MAASLFTASHLAVNILSAQSLLAAFGVLGVGVVMFAETGLLIGFFLPGDSSCSRPACSARDRGTTASNCRFPRS